MLFIFDWDGTIIDSTAKIISCMHRAIEENSLPARADQQVQNIIGLGLPEAILQLFPDINEAQLNTLRQSYSAHFVAADQVPCDFFPGVMTTLEQLRQRGHLLAVATGKSRKGLSRVLSNLEMSSYFDGSRCADETASKPDPLMLQQLLQELAVDNSDAIMVGDTEFDLAMAANADVASIGVSYGAHEVKRLETHNPRLCIDRFEQLLEWEQQVCR